MVITPVQAAKVLLQHLDPDFGREGLVETPIRWVRALKEMCCGYERDTAEVFKTFDGEQYDEMVVSKGIEFWSLCEHHLLPFFGKAHIGYIPDGRIVGLSKLSRLLEIYARRLQVQERLTVQITTALDNYLMPKGSACVIEASHACMICRGVQKQNSVMVTSSLTRVFRQPEVRAEFLSIVRR